MRIKYQNSHQRLGKYSHTSLSLHFKRLSKQHTTQAQLFPHPVVPYGPHYRRVDRKWFRVLTFAGFASRQWDRLHPSILCWSEDSSVRSRQRCVWQCTENQEGRGREAEMQWTVLHSHQAWAYHRWAWWLQSSCFWSGESQHITCDKISVMRPYYWKPYCCLSLCNSFQRSSLQVVTVVAAFIDILYHYRAKKKPKC